MVRPDYEPKKRKCLCCKKEFSPGKKDSRFCCRKCYLKWIREGAKNMSIEEAEWRMLTPEERWNKMTWEDISIECLRYHLSYGQAQKKLYTNSLPEDFGLWEKVLEKYRKEE